MIICNNCGRSNTGDSRFCNECGQRLTADVLPAFIPSVHAVQTPEDRKDQLRRLMETAFWHSDAGHNDAAIVACRAALAIDAECVSALSLLGSLFEKEGDVPMAIEAFERVVAINPDSVADAEKLDMLKGGIARAAIEPPKAYRWIPPAVAHYIVAHPKAAPAAGIGVAVAVLALGFWGLAALVNAARNAQTDTPRPVAAMPAPARPVVVDDRTPPVLKIVTPPAQQPPQSPVIQQASAYSTPEAAYQRQVAIAPNMMRMSQPGVVGQYPSSRRIIKPLPKAATADGLPSVSSVKPIDLTPSVAAAPVTVPDVPSHTVVVAAPPAVQAPQNPASNGPPPPAPRIMIRFHGASEIYPDAPADPVRPKVSATTGARGADLQARAIALQNQGNFDQAAATYRSAISAYQADLSAGRNTDFAKRGIDACETGIQICKQSQ